MLTARPTRLATLLVAFYSAPALADEPECATPSTSGIPAAQLVVLDAAANADATFCGSDAGYTSTVYLDSPTYVEIGTGHVTPAGNTVSLGAFLAGDELIFAIDVQNTGWTYYSGPGSRNPDGVVHAAVTDLGDGHFLIGFEDLWGGGDADYNDITLLVHTTGIEIVDEDTDDDGIDDDVDNCVYTPNPDQADADGDGMGDVCDDCPYDATGDSDGDGVCDSGDNCPADANADQADADEDGAGDVCDECPYDYYDDIDDDGVCADEDNCPDVYNDQTDSDGDGFGDVCDVCPYDADDDSDDDGICGDEDVCDDTVLPDGVPTIALGINRWADVNGDGVFETNMPKGRGPNRAYTLQDTAGCSCEQIIDALALGEGHTKFGCSISAMDEWVWMVNDE